MRTLKLSTIFALLLLLNGCGFRNFVCQITPPPEAQMPLPEVGANQLTLKQRLKSLDSDWNPTLTEPTK